MAEKKANVSPTADRELVMTRVVNAPRELVFKVWTQPKHIMQWWGPKGFTNTMHTMDVKPGGTWRFIMHGPDGKDWPNRIVYKEVRKNEFLSYTHSGDIDNDPHKFEVTVNFDKEGDKTKLTMRMVFATAEQLNLVVKEYGAIDGNKQTMERMENHLQLLQAGNEPEPEALLTITRTFNASKKLVYEAFSKPEHLAKWWGPKGFEINVVKLDLRPGGIFHYNMIAEGKEMWGRFIYLDIIPLEEMQYVSSFSDKDGNITRAPFGIPFPLEVMNVLTFTEDDGKTTITLKGGPILATEEERQCFANMNQSMQQGFKGTFDQLEEYLATL